jgi:hypothetical protein
LCDRRVGRGRGRGGFGDCQGGWGAGGGTVPSVQIFSHTTQVHHGHANHPHVHAARYNHGEQGARVSTRRRKGVDVWPTRSARRPSADTTTAQIHTSSHQNQNVQCSPQLSLNKHARTHDDCEFMATAGPTVQRCVNTYQNRGLIRHWKVCHLGCACVCVCVWRLSLGHQLHDKTWKVFLFLKHRQDAHASRCLPVSPHLSGGLTALVNW